MPHDFSRLVSIITPTFNQERYVGECIESVLRQTYPHWEQIIIDDGSTDGTAKVIGGYKDPRIRYFFQENQGVFELARTYNRALSFAKGELIAILEGDDFWPGEKLGTLVPAFADPAVVLAFGEVQDTTSDGEKLAKGSHTDRFRRKLPPSVLSNNPIGAATRTMLLAEGVSLIGASTVVLRRTALERIGGFQSASGLIVVDYPTFLTLSLTGSFYFTERIMGFHRRHSMSTTFHYLAGIRHEAYLFAMRFIEKHQTQLPLTPAQLAEIKLSWDRSEYKQAFFQGRFLLWQRQGRQARRHFRVALRSSEPSVLLAALAGYLLSWLHRDLEGIMRLFGRGVLR